MSQLLKMLRLAWRWRWLRRGQAYREGHQPRDQTS